MRRQKNRIVFLALSPTACATALGLNYDRVISPAIASGALGPVYAIGAKRRLLVIDIERFVRSFPQQSKPKRRKSTHA